MFQHSREFLREVEQQFSIKFLGKKVEHPGSSVYPKLRTGEIGKWWRRKLIVLPGQETLCEDPKV